MLYIIVAWDTCIISMSFIGIGAIIRYSASQTYQLQILHSAGEDTLFPVDSKIACLCQRIKINNKYVYRRNQVLKPTGGEVKWAEC